jgi:dTDP-4-amino-4,6-dideoxygalactose transaminase
MPCEMDKICAIAKKHHLFVIEDCAHAHLSRYKGKYVGNWGDVGTFSFQASKVLTSGEGGAIVCNDDKLAGDIYCVADAGRHPGEWFYNHYSYGSNFRLGEFQAALLRSQLKKYPNQLKKRNETAIWLNTELSKIPGVHPQKRNPGVEICANYVYAVYFEPEKFGSIEYKEMYAELSKAGIPTDAFYPQLDQLGLFKDVKLLKGIDYSKANWGHEKSAPGKFPVVEKISKSFFEFPQELLLSDQPALQYIVDTIKSIQQKYMK